MTTCSIDNQSRFSGASTIYGGNNIIYLFACVSSSRDDGHAAHFEKLHRAQRGWVYGPESNE